MHRFYEWIKFLLQEKVNIFFKGAWSGWIISGIFLFGSSFDSKTAFILAYLIKVFAVLITGLLSGFATILGNDIYHWLKNKVMKRRSNKSKRKKAA